MTKKITLVNFILDKSGSMESVRESTISGFNEYIQTLKKDTKSQYEFTLTTFNTEWDQVIKGEAIKDVKPLTRESYSPDGGTALYDAVCSSILHVSEKKNQKVITIIMTDGEENSSKEYTQVEMKEMIQDREKRGNWTFVYLGANQDSYAVAQKYGIAHGNTVNFTSSAAGMGASMRTMASNTVMYASSNTASTSDFFSKEDQDKLENTK